MKRMLAKRGVLVEGVARLSELFEVYVSIVNTRLREYRERQRENRERRERLEKEERIRKADAQRASVTDTRNVPAGSTDNITGDEIEDKDVLEDFNNHYAADGMYFKYGTTDRFARPIDPYTRLPIANKQYYIAKVDGRVGKGMPGRWRYNRFNGGGWFP
jgi:hypothetical protein